MPIVGITGAGRAGRTTAAEALRLLGYEPVSFANRLRHVIANSIGLPDAMMSEKLDERFERTITLQAFHIDGMCRLAAAWTTIPDDAPKRMREKAAKASLTTPREVMSYVRHELFEACVSPQFWVEWFKAHYSPDKDSNLVVDDVVSDAERQYVHALGGLLIGVDRPGVEASFDGCDLVIANDGSPEQLQDRVVAGLIGHFRGTPMSLGDGSVAVTLAPPAAAAPDPAVNEELKDLRVRVERLTSQLDAEAALRRQEVGDLTAERDHLLAAQSQRGDGAPVERPEPVVAPPASAATAAPAGRNETDAAALAVRLALALGLEAGLGKDARNQPMLCIDLPAGRVSWFVGEADYSFLPRYDKAPTQLSATEQRRALLDPQVRKAVSTEQALQREHSELAPVSGVLQDLILLAEGCKVHRAYRAKQAPKGDCPTCWSMWEGTERLRSMSNTYGGSSEPSDDEGDE